MAVSRDNFSSMYLVLSSVSDGNTVPIMMPVLYSKSTFGFGE